MRIYKVLIVAGLLLCGLTYADDSTFLDTEIMQFINSTPEKLDGLVLIGIANSLRGLQYKNEYIAESILCYQKGLERRIAALPPQAREGGKNMLLREYRESFFYNSAPGWAKEYILRYIISNSTYDRQTKIKEYCEKELNGMLEMRRIVEEKKMKAGE